MNDVPRWDLTALYASVEAQSLEEALRQSEEAFAALAAACAACESAQLPELLIYAGSVFWMLACAQQMLRRSV